MKSQTARFAVVGLGYWGPNLLRVLNDLDGCAVRWLCDVDEERLRRFGDRHPDCLTTTSFDEVIEDDAVDAVVIATPVFTHYDLASRSIAAGKHTFVEKPLASSSALAEELIDVADEHDRLLMCGHTFIYSPPVTAVKDLLDRNVLGELFFVSSSRVNLGLHQRDVSVVWDLGPHDFSILLYWLGEIPTSVRAVGRDSIVEGIPDVAFVALTFPSGVVANIELSWLAPSKLRRTVLVGREKMVVYEDGAPEPVRVFDHGVVYEDPESFGEYQLSYRTGDILSPKLSGHEPLSMELADFAHAVRAGDSMREHTRLAKNVVRVTEAADRSLHEGGRPIQLPARETLHDLNPRVDDAAAEPKVVR
ncbi:MAG TPA: Gfo/Idh/MocA family oxidoreductase [Solirubrobacteraceae bacterium]|jgi:predicted dehydrogenase|nr:Gfo/Idh/MocA family oxidoreductase [Solirubrobacteraceae bacterium]